METDSSEESEVIAMEEQTVPERRERPERPQRPERPDRLPTPKQRPQKPPRPIPPIPTRTASTLESTQNQTTTTNNNTITPVIDMSSCVITVVEVESNNSDLSIGSTESQFSKMEEDAPIQSELDSTNSEASTVTDSASSAYSPFGVPRNSNERSGVRDRVSIRSVFLFGLMGEGKSCFANMLQDEERAKQEESLFPVHAGQAEGTTRYQIEEVVSLDGEALKIIDLPGVNQTKMKPNSKETLFWSELSEAFTAAPQGFDAAVLTIRCSNRLTEEALLFWELFFTDNFGYSIWNRIILVLTFGDEIMSSFANKAAYLKSCASDNPAFGKLLNKVNYRCIVIPSLSYHARVHIQDFLTQLEKIRVYHSMRKYSDADFRRCQKMQWSNRAQLAHDQQKLLQESEERKQQYDKAINHLNQLRAKELELHANIIAQAFGAVSTPSSAPSPSGANSYRSFSDRAIRSTSVAQVGVARSPSDFVQAQQSPLVDVTPHEWMVNITTHDPHQQEMLRQDLNNKLMQRQQQQSQNFQLHQMNTRRPNILESTELPMPPQHHEISLSPIPIAEDQQQPENAPPPSPKKKSRMKKAFRNFSRVIKR